MAHGPIFDKDQTGAWYCRGIGNGSAIDLMDDQPSLPIQSDWRKNPPTGSGRIRIKQFKIMGWKNGNRQIWFYLEDKRVGEVEPLVEWLFQSPIMLDGMSYYSRI